MNLVLQGCLRSTYLVLKRGTKEREIVTLADRTFSKLLLKKYLRSTISQEILNSLATCSIENNIYWKTLIWTLFLYILLQEILDKVGPRFPSRVHRTARRFNVVGRPAHRRMLGVQHCSPQGTAAFDHAAACNACEVAACISLHVSEHCLQRKPHNYMFVFCQELI
jgi:hypothetical protein